MTLSNDNLDMLESESIHIFREAASQIRRPVLMYSIGKDSTVLLHLARKAFHPARLPFPLLHIDTGWKFREMIDFRDAVVKQHALDLIVHSNTEGAAAGISPATHAPSLYTDVMKTQALKQALDRHGFDAAYGGARRDEEASRAKERVFSVRSAGHRWDPRRQRSEMFGLLNCRLDRAILGRAEDGVLVVTAADERDPSQRALRVGRLKTLERLGLAEERQTGVWQLDKGLEPKLRQLGERADKFKMMQRALKEAGVDRAASAMALFEKKPRKQPLIGKVVGVGMVDEITDRTWVIVDAVDGRVHYAELGRLKPETVPARGMLVALAGDNLTEKPSPVPTLHVLSPVAVDRLSNYEGPTWLDEAIVQKWRPDPAMPGMAAELRSAITDRGAWLASRQLAVRANADEIAPVPQMMVALRKVELQKLAKDLSKHLNAEFMPSAPGTRVSGVYDCAVQTPTGKIAVIRNQDTFTLAPWKPALEPMRGLTVNGTIGPSRVTWTLDRARVLPTRG